MFVGIDGFTTCITRLVKSTDTYFQMPAATATSLLALLPDGSYTYLVLEDGVMSEIVRVDAGFAGITNGGLTDVPVTRGVIAGSTRFNMPALHTRLTYRLTTPGVMQLIAQALAGQSTT